jgi:hypothetical protein
VSLALAGCGGGGGGGGGGGASVPPPDPGDGTGAIDRGGVAVGPIDGFGSVIVNGVRFNTDDAVIFIDGAAASETDLSVGQVVLVVGTFNDDGTTGTAERIEYDESVEGPIEAGSLDVAGNTFHVLKQVVIVNASTSFDNNIQPPGLAGLAEGDFVEVSGLRDAAGQIIATRIEKEGPGDTELEVTGIVDTLDEAAQKFTINDLVVDYSGAQLDDFPGGVIRIGDIVEAEGNGLSAADELIATQVESRDELDPNEAGEDGDEVEIEGLITELRSTSDFDIGLVRVITNAGTVFEGGTAGDLAVDVRVEADGEFDASGALVAEKIEFEAEDDLEIEAIVDGVNAVSGELVLMGTTAFTDAGTRFEDKLNDLHMFGIGDINVGDFVEAKGSLDGDRFVASLVERDDAEDEQQIQGPAENVSAPSFTILDTQVMTNAGTEFRDGDENPLSAEDFFAAADGRIVQASGTWDGAMLIAEEVEFEDDD